MKHAANLYRENEQEIYFGKVRKPHNIHKLMSENLFKHV